MDAVNPETFASGDQPAVTPKPRVSKSVALWGILGALSIIYLGLLFVRPEILSTYLPTVAPVGAPESNEGQRANALAATQDLRDKVYALETEVEALRGDIASKTDAISLKAVGLDDRITALEAAKIAAAPGTPVGKAAAKAATAAASAAPLALSQPAPAAQPAEVAVAIAPATAAATAPLLTETPAAAPASKKKAAAAAAKVTAPASPAAPGAPAINAAASIAPSFEAGGLPGVKLLNSIPPVPAAPVQAPAAAPAAATAVQNPAAAIAPPLVTGSVDGAPAARVAKPVGVYIGSGPSLDAVRSSWSLLSSRHADSLAGLQPRYTSSMDAEGMNYGLVAGPLKTTADAQKVCKDLAAKAVSCRIGEFGGEAL